MFGAPPRMMSSSGGPPPPRSVSGVGSSMNMTNALVLSEMESGAEASRPEVSERAAPALDPVAVAEKQRQLIELRKEHATQQRAEHAQAELDQLNMRRFELTERAERLKKVEAERQRLVDLYTKESVLRSLPLGFTTRIERFEELQRKHEAERARTSEELGALQHEEHAFRVLPLSRDPYVVAGILGAILSIAFAISMSVPALAWLNVLAMVVGAGGAFRYISDLEQKHKLGMKLRGARERFDRIERQYGEDVRATKELMIKLEIESPQHLLERVRGYEKLQHQIKTVDEALKTLMADPEIAAAKREIDQISLRAEVLEGEVTGSQGGSASAETLAKRIKVLEAELGASAPSPGAVRAPPPRRTSSAFFPPPAALPRSESFLSGDIPPVPPFDSGQTAPADPRRSPHTKWDEEETPGYGSGYGGRGPSRPGGGGGASGMMAIGFGGPPGALGGGGLGGYGGYGDDSGPLLTPDRSRDLFQVARDVLSIEVDDLAQKINKRLCQYLVAFTDKVYRECSFGPRGELSVMSSEGDPVPYAELPPSVIDMVDSALRFTLIEACLTQVRVPILFDDPFARFAPKKRMLLGQMLGYLGNNTQVIVLTDQADIQGNQITI